MGATNPEAFLLPTSPKSRDDVLHVQYSMEAALRGRGTAQEPIVGKTTLLQVEGDTRTKKYADQYGSWVLRAKKGGTSDQTLIFSPTIKPSDALQADPSDKWVDVRDHRWDRIVRGQPKVQFNITGNAPNADYGGCNIILDEVPATTTPTEFLIEVWWTTESWDQTEGGKKSGPNLRNWLSTNRPQPTLLRFLYPLLRDPRLRSFLCLHEQIITPPLSGVKTQQGRIYSNLNVPGYKFKRTNHISWIDHAYTDRESKINGRYRRIRQTALVPRNVLRQNEAPEQYTSA